jgi:hypothetical protein
MCRAMSVHSRQYRRTAAAATRTDATSPRRGHVPELTRPEPVSAWNARFMWLWSAESGRGGHIDHRGPLGQPLGGELRAEPS